MTPEQIKLVRFLIRKEQAMADVERGAGRKLDSRDHQDNAAALEACLNQALDNAPKAKPDVQPDETRRSLLGNGVRVNDSWF